MTPPRKTAKQYRAEELAKVTRMNAARKRNAAAKHEATAARLRAEAAELEKQLAS